MLWYSVVASIVIIAMSFGQVRIPRFKALIENRLCISNVGSVNHVDAFVFSSIPVIAL